MNDERDHDRECWQRVESIYREAREHDGEARAALLDRACSGDSALRAEVESLLACEAAAEDFIETPALAIAADLLTHPTIDLLLAPCHSGASTPRTTHLFPDRP